MYLEVSLPFCFHFVLIDMNFNSHGLMVILLLLFVFLSLSFSSFFFTVSSLFLWNLSNSRHYEIFLLTKELHKYSFFST